MKIKGKEIDDYAVYATYLGDIGVGHMYESPFRDDDTSPSFGIYDTTYEDGNTGIIWKDYGLDQEHYDSIEFVKELHKNIRTRQQAKDKIYRDIILNKRRHRIKPSKRKKKEGKIGVRYRTNWSKIERAYWDKISMDTLRKYKVFPVVSSWFYNKLCWVSDDVVPTYVYIVGNGWQLYRPHQGLKFLSHNTSTEIIGWEQLPETSDKLVITSSGKDVVSIVESGTCAIAPFGEKNMKNILLKINEIDRRFKEVYIVLDNDRVGMKAAKDLQNVTGWNNITLDRLPKLSKKDEVCKDPSDILWEYDMETLRECLWGKHVVLFGTYE